MQKIFGEQQVEDPCCRVLCFQQKTIWALGKEIASWLRRITRGRALYEQVPCHSEQLKQKLKQLLNGLKQTPSMFLMGEQHYNMLKKF